MGRVGLCCHMINREVLHFSKILLLLLLLVTPVPHKFNLGLVYSYQSGSNVMQPAVDAIILPVSYVLQFAPYGRETYLTSTPLGNWVTLTVPQYPVVSVAASVVGCTTV